MDLNVHSCMLLFPEVAIQYCFGKQAQGFLEFKNSTCNYDKFRENHLKITMKVFNFGKISSLQPATILKINFAASIFQRFCLAFKNGFFHEQLSLSASVFPLKSVSYSLPEVIYCKSVLKIFVIFPAKHPCGCVISIKLHHNSI